MKRTIIFLTALALCGAASATVKPPVTPEPAPGNTQHQMQNQTAVGVGVGTGIGVGVGGAGGSGTGHGGAAQAAGGSSGAYGNGVGQGGSASGGTSASDASSYNALSTAINDNAKMYSLAFAPPVWTLVPQANGKCTVSESGAHQVLFGAWAKSGSKQFTDRDCAMAEMSNAYRQACRFKTAAHIDKYLFERFTEGAPGDFFLDGAVDLTPVQCADLMRPRLVLDARLPQPSARASE
jgi:hypothetical protein